MSNALEKSKKTPQEYELFSIAFRRLSAVSAMACAVERPLLKPNWSTLVFVKDVMLLKIFYEE